MSKLMLEYANNIEFATICSNLKLIDLIDTIISHNEIVALWEDDSKEPHFSNLLWKGMAHKIPSNYLNYTFERITGVVADSIYNSDWIHIHICKPVDL